MSQVLKNYMGKKDTNAFILQPDALNELEPVCRASAVTAEALRIFDSGDKEHLENFLNRVQQRFTLISGVYYHMNRIASVRTLDDKIENAVTLKMRERDKKNENKPSNDSELIMHLYQKLWNSGRDAGGKINWMDFLEERMYFAIDTGMKNYGGLTTGVFCEKYIPSYRIRFQTPWDPDNPQKNGVWEFPGCIIGVHMEGSQSGGKWKVGFSNNACVIYPRPYIHPYTSDSGSICVGNFSNSETATTIRKRSLFEGLVHFLRQIEHIIKTGYHEGHLPLRAHLTTNTFSKLKKYDSLEDERKALKKKAVEDVDVIIDGAIETTKRIYKGKRKGANF